MNNFITMKETHCHYSIYRYDYNGKKLSKISGPFLASHSIMERIVEETKQFNSLPNTYLAYDYSKES